MNAWPPALEARRRIRRVDGPLVAIVLLAIAVRAAATYAYPAALERDPDSYRLYAQSLIDHGNFLRHDQPSAWRAPLYPLTLAVCLMLPGAFWWWIAALHVACGALATWLVVGAGRAAGLGATALIAGAVVALDPLLVYQATQVMSESLAVLLTALALWQIGRATFSRSGDGLLLGATLAGCALVRPGLLAWGALLLIGLFWNFRHYRPWQRVGPVLLGLVVVLAPWTLRNAAQLGRPVLTTTHGGFTFLLANNPELYDFLRERKGRGAWSSRQFVETWEAEKTTRNVDSELAENRLAYQIGWQNVRQAPADFLRATLFRVTSFWRLAPLADLPTTGLSQQLGRLGITFWNFGLFALALLGVLAWDQRRRSPPNDSGFVLTAGLLLVLSLQLVHLAYWTDMRMRAPAVPALALLAALGWQWLAAQRRAKPERQ